MIDAKNYNITVRKGMFDGELCFEARVAELPDIAEYADSFEEAYALAIDTIEITAEIFLEQGRTMPTPIIPADNYSGRVTLRLPKSLHRSLAQAADKEEVSLNQYLNSVLNCYASYPQATFNNHNNENIWQKTSIPEKQKHNPHLKIVRDIPTGNIAKYAA